VSGRDLPARKFPCFIFEQRQRRTFHVLNFRDGLQPAA
jgi:hypothetical protein